MPKTPACKIYLKPEQTSIAANEPSADIDNLETVSFLNSRYTDKQPAS